jgi:hypothetical protein
MISEEISTGWIGSIISAVLWEARLVCLYAYDVYSISVKGIPAKYPILIIMALCLSCFSGK